MKIAVTTASGNLGSAIVERLKIEIGKENIVAIARTPEKAAFLDVEIRKGDYNSKTDFLTALKNIDVVLLVSGMDHPDKRIQQHRNVIEAAKKNGVKKIVYTSIMGAEKGNGFSPVVVSNRQTEKDVRQSGLQWAIGRNGIYIEPDLEYIENYKKENGIINCAGEGLCGYTSRKELACAYYKLIIDNKFNGGTYNLFGEAITQQQLTENLNKVFNINLIYKYISVKEFTQQRQKAIGEFMGTIIGGIYEGINQGTFNGRSDFMEVAGRSHRTVKELIEDFKNNRQ